MKRITIILILSTMVLVWGCADTKEPAGPEDIPYFDVVVTPDILALCLH